MDDIGQVVLKVDKLLKQHNISKSKLARQAKIQYKKAKSYCDNNYAKG